MGGPDIDQINAGVVQDDGKIVLVGETIEEFVVLRFNPEGSLDTGFGSSGVVTGTFSPEGTSDADAVALDPGGRIVVVGTARIEVGSVTTTPIGVARLLGDGTIDSSFSGDGLLTLDTSGAGSAVRVQSDGKVLVAGGRSAGGTGSEAVVFRLLDDGSSDTSFDGDGLSVLNFGGLFNGVDCLLVQPDGAIVVGGGISQQFSQGGRGVIARLTTDGALDTTFADSGTYLFGEELARTRALRMDSGGNIVAAGDGLENGYLVRLDGDGQPDMALGNGIDGVVILDPQSKDSLALVDDDTILMGGGNFRVTRVVPRPDVNFAGGSLFLTGGDGDDTISLDVDGGDVDVTRNGVTTTIALADLDAIDIELHGGADQVMIDPLLQALLRADLGEGDNSFSAGALTLSTFHSGSGNDMIALGVIGEDPNSFRDNLIATGDGDDSITLGDHEFRVIVEAGAGNDVVSVGDGTSTIRGGEGNDLLSASDGNHSINGEGGDDTLFGGAGVDSIYGEDGNDSIDAGGGIDLVFTGDGLNTATGGAGDDTVFGGILADSLLGGDGNDSIGAGNGANTIFGGAGNDVLRGGNDNDWMWGESGYDTMKGGLGGDFLHGGNGKDRLFGQEGNDRLYGSGNDDHLAGGPGMDLMVGGDRNDKIWADDDEADTIDGGAGDDQADLDGLLDVQSNVETLLA